MRDYLNVPTRQRAMLDEQHGLFSSLYVKMPCHAAPCGLKLMTRNRRAMSNERQAMSNEL